MIKNQQMLKEKERAINLLMTAVDVLLALISFNIAIYFEFGKFTPDTSEAFIIIQLLIVITWILLSGWLETNLMARSRPYSMLLINCVRLTIFGISLLIIAAWAFNLFYLGFKLFTLFGLIYLPLSYGTKLFAYRALRKNNRKHINNLNILVLGDNTAIPFIRQLLLHPEWGYRISAIIGYDDMEAGCPQVAPFLSQYTDIEQLLRQKTIDELIVCKENLAPSQLESLVNICTEVGVVFRLYSPLFNMLASHTQISYFGTTPFLTISTAPVNYLALTTKYVIDRILSFLALIVVSPLMLAIAIAIKVDSKGPVFFKQKRVGLRGRKFAVMKFRTMVVNAEALRENLLCDNEMDGPVFKIANDPRITRVGKFLRKTSLDEIPQFINVLLGEMSLVGPRPPLPKEVKEYKRWQLRRLSMKPGITCIWQVSGRNSISFEDWMRMDMEYIDNWSLKLDFMLLLKTMRVFIKLDGR